MLETMKGRSLSTIGYLGAPLDRVTGDVYAEFLQVQGFLGSTEVGPMPVVVSKRSDWLSYRFHPRSGCRMEPWQGSSEGGTKYYESVFDRRLDVKGTLFVFQAHPELQIFRSNDLYSKHPEMAGCKLFQGRADDLVKNFNLTKVNATQIESMIERDTRIRAALVGGDGLKNPFTLLEMDEINMSSHESGIMDQIWPSLAKVNQSLSKEIVVQRNRVIIAPPEKPSKRLGKGTVNRRDTLVDFREEIAALQDDDQL